MSDAFGGFYVVAVLFLLFLAILWICLPFAVFGTKDRLDKLISETKKTNSKLEKLAEAIRLGRVTSGSD